MTKVHKLEHPLLLSSDENDKNYSLLPKGTVLYFDQAFPEGFTRYKVYINIDRMPLDLKELGDPTIISPIEASFPSPEQLSKLLSQYPLTKEDIKSLLKSGYLSKDDIRALLEEFSK